MKDGYWFLTIPATSESRAAAAGVCNVITETNGDGSPQQFAYFGGIREPVTELERLGCTLTPVLPLTRELAADLEQAALFFDEVSNSLPDYWNKAEDAATFERLRAIALAYREDQA